jgi:hypothetical protein
MLSRVGTCQKRLDLPSRGEPPARAAGPIEVAFGLSNAAIVIERAGITRTGPELAVL